MRWLGKILLLLALLTLTWLANIAHLGVAIPPADPLLSGPPRTAHWYPKSQWGLNHIVLSGNAFERGYGYGYFTRELLRRQEESLYDRLRELFPSRLALRGLELFAKRWFWGIDDYLEEDWKREMHGVSLSAPKEFDFLADPYTRQIAYHGLHEVGQMFVDYGSEGFACTVLAVPNGASWLVGRNLDFEGGRIFDEEKIVKWVFPDKGVPFVSVIWAGMVGAVTGVNANGVYLSINAAGSEQFSRLGTPSTLLLLRALQTARNAEEAVGILKGAKTIITESFVVADPGSVFVVEKSPAQAAVRKLTGPAAVANHLLDPIWANDKVNIFRRAALTSSSRWARAQELAARMDIEFRAQPALPPTARAAKMVTALRDKSVGGALRFGNRAAIDAQIATHAVVYDGARGVLFVSQGPSLTGKFLGYDLAKSFASRKPVPAEVIPEDPELSPGEYGKLKADIALFERWTNLKRSVDCAGASSLQTDIAGRREHYLKFMALAHIAEACQGREQARAHWIKALALDPAYARERRLIEEHLK